MIKAYLLYTGEDGHSHVKAGSIAEGASVKADHALFKETAAHSSFDWHNAPVSQYVITLSGILEFSTKTGEIFTIHPGEVLLAIDVTGSGHQWRLLNDEPWKRLYLVFQENADTFFIPDDHNTNN
jgi:quercetin dioxygenase-like cupin family protein